MCNRHTLIVANSLLTDMNRLLIHSNGTGDGYTPAVASTAAAALTHAAASIACAAAPAAAAALNGSGDGPGSGSGGGSGNPSGNNNDVRRLQDEVNQLTKRNGGNPSPIQPQFCLIKLILVLLGCAFR